MSVRRRVLAHKDCRCHPVPQCPLQSGCARFTTPLPQGIGATVANYRDDVIAGTGSTHFCPQHLSEMVTDAELAQAAKKPVKPPIGDKS